MNRNHNKKKKVHGKIQKEYVPPERAEEKQALGLLLHTNESKGTLKNWNIN